MTFATIDAAAIAAQRRSPCGTPRCTIGISGTRNASTSTTSGSGDQGEDGPLHRAQRGLMDVDAIDLSGVGGGDTPGNRVHG